MDFMDEQNAILRPLVRADRERSVMRPTAIVFNGATGPAILVLNMMKNPAVLFWFLYCLHGLALASYESGERQFKLANYSAAQSEWSAAAASGSSKAAYMLGIGLLSDRYFPIDETAGLRYLQDASRAGYGAATYALYLHSKSKPGIQMSEAIKLLELAAAQGSKRAELTLGLLRSGAGSPELTSDLDILVPITVTRLTDQHMPAAITRGEQIYQRSCATCHTIGIANAPKHGDAERWAALSKKGFDLLVQNAVKGIGAHPPRGGNFLLSGDEVRDAVAYMSAVSR